MRYIPDDDFSGGGSGPLDMAPWSLAYVSRASDRFGPDDLNAALKGARVRNEALGVASLLVHWDGWILHVLEGPREHVLVAFDCFTLATNIHGDIILADQGPVAARSQDSASAMDIRVPITEADVTAVESLVQSALSEGGRIDAEMVDRALCSALRPVSNDALAA